MGPLTPMWSLQGLSRLVRAAEDSAMEQTLARHSQTLDHPAEALEALVEVLEAPAEVLDHPVEISEAPAEVEAVDAQPPMNSNAPQLMSSNAPL